MEKLLIDERIRPLYNISDNGEITATHTNSKMNVLCPKGYIHSYVSLLVNPTFARSGNNGYNHNVFRVDELVMETFGAPKPSPNSYVYHIDENPLNNDISNLIWIDEYLINNGYHKLDNFDDIYPNYYWINEYGEIWSVLQEKRLIPRLDKDGYLTIDLKHNENCGVLNKNRLRLHYLTLKFFKGDPPEDLKHPTVDHIDHNTLNNHISNLRWLENTTNITNRIYDREKMSKALSYFGCRGEDIGTSKLNNKTIKDIIRLSKQGKNSYEIREELDLEDINKSTINRVRNHERWSHISIPYEFTLNHDYTDFDDSPEFIYSEKECNEYCDTVEEMKEFSPFSEVELIY